MDQRYENVRTNSSVDDFIGQCKNNWLGAGFRNRSMNLTEFFGSVLEDAKQKSIEHHNMLMSPDFGISAFQKFSVVSPDVVSALKTLHLFCLWLAQPFFGQKEYVEGMTRLYSVDKDGKPSNCKEYTINFHVCPERVLVFKLEVRS